MKKITATIKGASSLEATLTPERGDITCTLEKSPAVNLEKREVIPSDEVQRVTPGDGYGGLEEVTVAAIPSNYGKITYDGSKILVS